MVDVVSLIGYSEARRKGDADEGREEIRKQEMGGGGLRKRKYNRAFSVHAANKSMTSTVYKCVRPKQSIARAQ